MYKRLTSQFRNSRYKPYSRKGNALAEYAFIALLVVVGCITAFQLVGSSFNLAMAKVRNDMTAHKQHTIALLVQKKAQLKGFNTTLTQSQLKQLQMSLSDKLQTTGANGSTTMLANQIAATAGLLFSQGKINQSQYDILMKLSNQGHEIALIEHLISDALIFSNGDYSVFNSVKIDFQGQTYTARQLAALIGVNMLQPHDFQATNILTMPPLPPNNKDITVIGVQPELSSFLSLYQEAISNGALADPVAASSVSSASIQIAQIGEIVEDLMTKFEGGSSTSPDALINGTRAAELATSMNSSTICTTGDFQDNGVLCTP